MPRKTRQKIRDHVQKAIGHVENAIEQLSLSMSLGEDRSKECAILVPKIIELLIEQRDLIEALKNVL